MCDPVIGSDVDTAGFSGSGGCSLSSGDRTNLIDYPLIIILIILVVLSIVIIRRWSFFRVKN